MADLLSHGIQSCPPPLADLLLSDEGPSGQGTEKRAHGECLLAQWTAGRGVSCLIERRLVVRGESKRLDQSTNRVGPGSRSHATFQCANRVRTQPRSLR